MKLFHARNSCSLGILALIEETGAPFELEIVDLAAGQQRSAEFLKLNPKGKIPLLQLDDGSLLSEWPAIATYLALTFPKADLLPATPLETARVYEATDYLVATTHMLGFTRIVRPGNFAPSEGDHGAASERGREIFDEGFKAMAQRLEGQTYLFGALTIADAALFYLENWMVNRLKGELPPAVQAHFETLSKRPAFARALSA